MTDLIKRDDALAAIDTFKRDFEQSWKVQFSADIKALPAIDPAAIRDAADRIEELERELDEYKEAAKVWQEDFIQENQRLYEAKVRLAVVVEERDQYKAAAEICGKAARAMLAELEGKE